MDQETRSFEYTRTVLGKLDSQARKEIERLGGNVGLTKFLDRMLDALYPPAKAHTNGQAMNGVQ
jgi:hypothetical protein